MDTHSFATASLGIADRPGFVRRLLMLLGGANPSRLAACPADDRIAAVRVGIGMLISFCFITVALCLAMSIAFELDAGGVAAVLPVAALMAGAYLCVDHAIVQSDWHLAGLREARRRGFQPDGPALPGWPRRLAVVALRLLLSGSLAFLAAGFIEITVFSPDIERQRLENNRHANAAVFTAAALRVDQAIARRDAVLAEAERAKAATLRRHEDAAAALQDAIQRSAAATEPRRRQLQTERDMHLAEAARRRADAVAEEFGLREQAHHSGVRGCLRNCRAAMAMAARSEARAAELAAEIQALERAAPVAFESLRAGVALARADLEGAAARVAEHLSERDRLAAERDAAVRAAALADPRYVALRDGLIERMTVLGQLLVDRNVLAMALGLKLFIMVVEMAGLLAKLLVSSPGLYGIRTAAEHESGAAETIAQAETDLSAQAAILARAQEAREEIRAERERNASRRRTARMAREWCEAELR